MATVLAILQLLPAIIAAVQAVEAAVGAGNGQSKLNLVLAAIESAGTDVSKILPAITIVIAKIVSTFNALGIFKSSSTAAS